MGGMKLVRQALALAFVAALLSACGGSDGTIAADKVDRDAWRTELRSLDGVGNDPDLDELDRLTREDCDTKVDDLALRFTLQGARPDVVRVNMKYVCPKAVKKVDAALKQIESLD